ncbi:LPS assembly protein LptD [uncultured Sphingomonas sp.]|uniref:LPS-assembly protein LptD n=1 Tax=uncultured Sphingomonas sp. TaxID=158754 RepID=UPI002603F7AD|nr:LPS assembly protein LptD [uncultured Sphingomonas sp.]
MAGAAEAQDLQDRAIAPPPPSANAPPGEDDQIQFSATALEYDYNDDIVTATGDVRMFRQGQRLRAERVVWNRKTGQVVANGNVAITNPEGDVAYGDSIDLTDSLRDGVVHNLLVVLDQGGRLAATQGTRHDDGSISLNHAAYSACSVTDSDGCPKNPSWKITAVKVLYRPDRERVYYTGARVHVFGFASVPLPRFSHPVGDGNASGLLSPNIRLDGVNGLEIVTPYYFDLSRNRSITITPHVFSAVLPMMQANYQALETNGAISLTGYITASRRSDDISAGPDAPTSMALRGYLDGVGRFQFDQNWSLSGSMRLVTDRTFLRRYDISNDDRLRTTLALERVDRDSYFSLAGWAVQTMRVGDIQGLQPVALPELDYRRRIHEELLGGTVQLQLNTLAIARAQGQDTQRAFAAVRWDLRRITTLGQEVTFTAYARADAYNTSDIAATLVPSYRGLDGFHTRGIAALAVDIRWPFVGSLFGGTQRFTPRFQIVASPQINNLDVPNEDARAVDLEDSNLFALNRFAGYDRWEDSSRATYGAEWALTLPGFTLSTVIGQSYRLSDRPSILPQGTGLSDRFSDIVGRTELRFRDFVSIIHRYRVDKDNFAVRRNEIDATIGSRSNYFMLGYLRLNRNITSMEDLQDQEELRVGGRIKLSRFWSAYGSTVIDLTNSASASAPILSAATSAKFNPVRHRLGITYEDDCLTIGATWRRDYQTTGDARAGNSYLLTLAFKNLGR